MEAADRRESGHEQPQTQGLNQHSRACALRSGRDPTDSGSSAPASYLSAPESVDGSAGSNPVSESIESELPVDSAALALSVVPDDPVLLVDVLEFEKS